MIVRKLPNQRHMYEARNTCSVISLRLWDSAYRKFYSQFYYNSYGSNMNLQIPQLVCFFAM